MLMVKLVHEWEKKRENGGLMLYYEVRDCFDEKVEKKHYFNV